MKKSDCSDCIALVESANGEWVCDELEKPIEDIKRCPEIGDTHTCRYCGNEAEGSDEDLLCADCHELFGHMYYSEL